QLAASWGALRALDAENELDAWNSKLDALKSSEHSSPSISVGSFVGFFDVLRVCLSRSPPPLSFSPIFVSFRVPRTMPRTLGCTATAPRRTSPSPPSAPCSQHMPPGMRGARTPLARRDVRALARVRSSRACSSTAIRLHFLLAVSAHCAHLVATTTRMGPPPALCMLPPAERAHGGCDVHTCACARGQRGDVGPRTRPRLRRTRGCSTRAWCTASASGSEGPVLVAILVPPAYLRLPPPPSPSGRYPYAVSVYIPPPSLPPPLPVPAPVILTLRTYIHTCVAPLRLCAPRPLPYARTCALMSLPRSCFVFLGTYRYQPVRYDERTNDECSTVLINLT
ncbi:hypothetical protein FB451DRAFT_1527636, partial [Mycena latifolia]